MTLTVLLFSGLAAPVVAGEPPPTPAYPEAAQAVDEQAEAEVAAGGEPATTEETEVLIEVETEAVPRRGERERPPESLFEERMAFRALHLEMRSLTRWVGGGATLHRDAWALTPYRPWWGPDPYWWGFGTSYVVREPIEEDRTWAVFQGVERLTIPTYLAIVGQADRADALQSRIRSARTTGDVLLGMGLLGLAGTVVGFVGSTQADQVADLRTWNIVGAASAGGMLVGFVGSGIASARARSLRYDFPRHLSAENVRTSVMAYNTDLAEDLGLTSREAWNIIIEDEPTRGQAER